MLSGFTLVLGCKECPGPQTAWDDRRGGPPQRTIGVELHWREHSGRALRTPSERTTCGNHLGGHCFGGHFSDTSQVLSGSVNAHHAEVLYCIKRNTSFTCTVDSIRDDSFVADTLTHAYLPRFTTVAFHTLTASCRQQVLYSTSLAAGRHDNGTRCDELHHIIIGSVDNLDGSTFQKYKEAYPWNNADRRRRPLCSIDECF